MKSYYLDAAELVAKSFNPATGAHYHACVAIGDVMSPDQSVENEEVHDSLFAEYFKPAKATSRDPWFGWTQSPGFSYTGKYCLEQLNYNKEQRVFALLFMHEITKDTWN